MSEFSSGSARRRSYVVGAAVLLAVPLLVFTLWPAAGNAAKPGAPGGDGGKHFGPGNGGAGMPVPVAAAIATQSDLAIYVDAPGTVTPVNSVVVRSRVDGQLQQVHFEEGQLVKAGDLLAQIDPRPFQVQLAQAQSALKRDEALLRNAQLDVERYNTLWSQDSISQQEVDTQKALVEQYRSSVDADHANIDSAQLQLTYSRVTSPISGRVGLRQIDAGNIVSSNDSNGLVLITQLQPIDIVFTVPEDNIAAIAQQLQRGNSLVVEAWNRDRSRKLAEGKLLTFDNQVDLATGTVKLKALFSNLPTANLPAASSSATKIRHSQDAHSSNANVATLFPNQFVNVRLLVETLKEATLVPLAAVQHGVQGDYVYQIQPDQTVKRQLVALGAVSGEHVAVTSGLAAGAQIVLEGSDRLRDGAKIQLIGDRKLEQATGCSAAPSTDARPASTLSPNESKKPHST